MMGERQNRVELANLMCTLEIGCLARVLPDPLPPNLIAAIEGALPHLDEAPPWPRGSARMRLLGLFRRRIRGEPTQELAPEDADAGRVAGVFSEFLALNDTLRDDFNVRQFIATLAMDEPQWNESVVRFLMTDEAFRRAMQAVLEAGQVSPRNFVSPELRFGSALIGAGTYANVMEALKGALDLVVERPMFRAAMWHYHAPAFAPSQAVERIDIWFSFARVQMRNAGLPEDDAAAWATDGEAALKALRAGEYAAPLAQVFGADPIDTREERRQGFGELTP
jgi:hypothetical protein